MGRPPTRPVTLRDGFYIEVRNKGANSGIKIRSDNEEDMIAAADSYRSSKEVVVLGEHKKGKWMNEDVARSKQGKSSKAPKAPQMPKESSKEIKAPVKAAAKKEAKPVKKAAAKPEPKAKVKAKAKKK